MKKFPCERTSRHPVTAASTHPPTMRVLLLLLLLACVLQLSRAEFCCLVEKTKWKPFLFRVFCPKDLAALERAKRRAGADFAMMTCDNLVISTYYIDFTHADFASLNENYKSKTPAEQFVEDLSKSYFVLGTRALEGTSVSIDCQGVGKLL